MRILALVSLLLFAFASNAQAIAAWSNENLNAEQGFRVSTLVPDANTQTATIETGECGGGLTVTCYGTGSMTGLIQLCNGPYAQAAAIDKSTCQDMLLSVVACATNHSVQVLPIPAQLRLANVVASGSGQNFEIVCAGSSK